MAKNEGWDWSPQDTPGLGWMNPKEAQAKLDKGNMPGCAMAVVALAAAGSALAWAINSDNQERPLQIPPERVGTVIGNYREGVQDALAEGVCRLVLRAPKADLSEAQEAADEATPTQVCPQPDIKISEVGVFTPNPTS